MRAALLIREGQKVGAQCQAGSGREPGSAADLRSAALSPSGSASTTAVGSSSISWKATVSLICTPQHGKGEKSKKARAVNGEPALQGYWGACRSRRM